jgi:hypothetical protein
MTRLFSAAAVCALAVGLTVAPSGVAKKGPKGPKMVGGTVSVFVTPTTITPTTLTVAASGNVKANSNCRKDRLVRFSYVNSATLGVTPLAQTAETRSNGDYSVVLPKPTDAPPAGVVLQATVDQQFRKVGSKKRKKGKKVKKGRQFNCMQLTGQSTQLAIAE